MAPDVGWLDVVGRLVLAAALTGAIGLERELRERVAGLRTHMLVGVGSALFTLVSAYAFTDFATGGARVDPTRIAAQIVSGIGFLGAGAILRQGLSVRGLTTAAALWMCAAIGMAAGAGFYSAALAATAIALVGLGPFRRLERRVNRIGGDAGILELQLAHDHSVGEALRVLERRRARIHGIEFDTKEGERWVRIDLELPRGASGEELQAEVAQLSEVVAVRWSG